MQNDLMKEARKIVKKYEKKLENEKPGLTLFDANGKPVTVMYAENEADINFVIKSVQLHDELTDSLEKVTDMLKCVFMSMELFSGQQVAQPAKQLIKDTDQLIQKARG